jgi:hypothetical protein
MATDEKKFSIEAFAVGGWKADYYADRGPRLHFRLCNVPKHVEEVELLVHTAISDQDPNRSELKSSQLHVRQMLEGGSMKHWFNSFQLKTNPPVIFRTKTISQVRAWISALNGDEGGRSSSSSRGKSSSSSSSWAAASDSSSSSAGAPASSTGNASTAVTFTGYCWQKPHDTKVWCSLSNHVLSVASGPGAPVTQSWNIADLPSPRAQVYTRRVTLNAANNWQSTAVYKLQVGFHGMQHFVAKVYRSKPAGVKAKVWRSPFFVVKSCNRHAAAKAGGYGASPVGGGCSCRGGVPGALGWLVGQGGGVACWVRFGVLPHVGTQYTGVDDDLAVGGGGGGVLAVVNFYNEKRIHGPTSQGRRARESSYQTGLPDSTPAHHTNIARTRHALHCANTL